jgi:hypothetical protein
MSSRDIVSQSDQEALERLSLLAQSFNDSVQEALSRRHVKLMDIFDFDALLDFEDAAGPLLLGPRLQRDEDYSPFDQMRQLKLANFFAVQAARSLSVPLPPVPAALIQAENAAFYRSYGLSKLEELSSKDQPLESDARGPEPQP